MKRIEVTKQVMDEVTSFEKRRSSAWKMKFACVVLGLWIGVVWSWFTGWVEVGRRGTLDMLAILNQNAEIVLKYGGETFLAISEEVPTEILIGVFGIFLLWGFVMIEKKKRQIVNRRLSQIKEYEKRNRS